MAVSGDLTQRARIAQFKEAKGFLNSLPSPQIVVPGNHDLPLDNLLLRLFSPLSRFKRYITRDLAPVYIDGEKGPTLKGERIAEEFQELVEQYVARRFARKDAVAAEQGVTA